MQKRMDILWKECYRITLLIHIFREKEPLFLMRFFFCTNQGFFYLGIRCRIVEVLVLQMEGR